MLFRSVSQSRYSGVTVELIGFNNNGDRVENVLTDYITPTANSTWCKFSKTGIAAADVKYFVVKLYVRQNGRVWFNRWN